MSQHDVIIVGASEHEWAAVVANPKHQELLVLCADNGLQTATGAELTATGLGHCEQ